MSGSVEQEIFERCTICKANTGGVTTRDRRILDPGSGIQDQHLLAAIHIHLPPLRKCGDDIMLIARKYLKDFSAEEGGNFKDFSAGAAELISRYQWPGNVRQLQNIIRNIVVLQAGEVITAKMLPALMNGGSDEVGAHTPGLQPKFNQAPIPTQLIQPLWLSEKQAIENAIEQCGGNVPRAAALLDVSPSTIYRKRLAWEGK